MSHSKSAIKFLLIVSIVESLGNLWIVKSQSCCDHVCRGDNSANEKRVISSGRTQLCFSMQVAYCQRKHPHIVGKGRECREHKVRLAEDQSIAAHQALSK